MISRCWPEALNHQSLNHQSSIPTDSHRVRQPVMQSVGEGGRESGQHASVPAAGTAHGAEAGTGAQQHQAALGGSGGGAALAAELGKLHLRVPPAVGGIGFIGNKVAERYESILERKRLQPVAAFGGAEQLESAAAGGAAAAEAG